MIALADGLGIKDYKCVSSDPQNVSGTEGDAETCAAIGPEQFNDMVARLYGERAEKAKAVCDDEAVTRLAAADFAMSNESEFSAFLEETLKARSGENAVKSGIRGGDVDGVDFVVFGAAKTWVKNATVDEKMKCKAIMNWYKTVSGNASIKAAAKGKADAKKAVTAGKAGSDGRGEGKDSRPLDDINRLQILVGKIVKVWPHPESELLYCEEVDVGEEQPRKIASGIQKFVPLEKMETAEVLVLANLKPRALRGFESHGMLLCASNADHSAVELMQPPPGARIGARVSFRGYSSEWPEADAVLSGKKNQDPLPEVLPHLRTEKAADGGDKKVHAKWKNHSMEVDGEPCFCDSLTDAAIN